MDTPTVAAPDDEHEEIDEETAKAIAAREQRLRLRSSLHPGTLIKPGVDGIKRNMEPL